MRIVGCARCGRDHDGVEPRKLDRPFAPPEAAPIVWAHWVPCPINGQPIMLSIDEDATDDDTPALHGRHDRPGN